MSSYRDIAPRPQDPAAAVASNSKTALANGKPSRVAAACITCRARRSKCDGSRPACRSCEKRNSLCRYDPPAGTLLAQAQKRKIEELENDKSSLYEVVWYLQTTSPDKATALLQHMRAAQGDDLGVIFKNFELCTGMASIVEQEPVIGENQSAPSASGSTAVVDKEDSRQLWNHPQFPVVPYQQYATVDKIYGILDMFFNCVGALFYIMNRDDVQTSMTAIKASGNGHTPLGDVFNDGSDTELRTYAAEISGMAAIGVVHSQLADPTTAPPAELADYFYAVAKHGLDSAISYSPLRAMKVCALLGMYNIVVKATVALAYIELGLSLPRNHKISLKQCPEGWSPSYYDDICRTHRTLVHLQCWLSASLDYDSDSVVLDDQSPQDGPDVPPEDMIRRECVKVSIIKASLLRRLPAKAPVLESTILEYRAKLSRFHARLPNWMSVKALLGSENTELMVTFRPVVFYVHLFYLSAMMLLSRRLIIAYIPLDATEGVSLPSEARTAVIEGYQAAETNASVMNLMLQEGKVVQVCWLCIYTSYTAGVMIAHKASQKALHSEPFPEYLVLMSKCIDVLEYCAIKDTLAGKFRNILAAHMSMLRRYESTSGNRENLATPQSSSSDDSLFYMNYGSSELHITARDLLRTIHHPFSGLKDITTHETLLNRAETTMGTHLEWEHELRRQGDADVRPEGDQNPCVTGVDCELTTALCASSQQNTCMQKLLTQPQVGAWTKWTPTTWQDSFHLPLK